MWMVFHQLLQSIQIYQLVRQIQLLLYMSSVNKPSSFPINNQFTHQNTLHSQMSPIIRKTPIYDDQCLYSSDEEEMRTNRMIVDRLYGKYISEQTEEDEDEDQDIKRFLEEQIPGLYQATGKNQIPQKEQSDDQNVAYTNGYKSSSLSQEYFTMSRFQRTDFFENLNSIYMAKMKPQGYSQSKKHLSNKNKPAIRFNQIVFEVPFNKEEEPCAVKGTAQEEAFIKFDDEAYEEEESLSEEVSVSYEEEMVINNGVDGFYENVRKGFEMSETSLYLEEMSGSEDGDGVDEQLQMKAYCYKRLVSLQELETNKREEKIFSSFSSDSSDSSSSDGSYAESSEEEVGGESLEDQHKGIGQGDKITVQSVGKVQNDGESQPMLKSRKRNAEGEFVDGQEEEDQQKEMGQNLNSQNTPKNNVNYDVVNAQIKQLKLDQQSDKQQINTTEVNVHANVDDEFAQGIKPRKIFHQQNTNITKTETTPDSIVQELQAGNITQPLVQPTSETAADSLPATNP